MGASGAEMIAWVQQVENSGALGVIIFHGVGGDYLAVSAEALFRALARDQVSAQWTRSPAPVQVAH